MPNQIFTLLQQALSTQSKSTVLKGLAWFISIAGTLALSAATIERAVWLSYAFGVITIIGMLSYLVAYWYFAITDKEALRSERFSIQKMAIERGVYGDDISGYVRLHEPKDGALIASSKAIGNEIKEGS